MGKTSAKSFRVGQNVRPDSSAEPASGFSLLSHSFVSSHVSPGYDPFVARSGNEFHLGDLLGAITTKRDTGSSSGLFKPSEFRSVPPRLRSFVARSVARFRPS